MKAEVALSTEISAIIRQEPRRNIEKQFSITSTADRT
jgi:hypothetical protein